MAETTGMNIGADEIIDPNFSKSVDSTAPGTVRTVIGKISATVTPVSGNLVGVRGECNVIATNGPVYNYGVQGKFIPTGALAGSSGFNCGVFAQLDVSGASFAHSSGYLAPIIADFSTAAHLTTDALADMMVLLNTSTCLINSIIKTEAKANFLLDLNDLGQGSYIVATAKGSGWDKSLKINLNGTTYYIPCNSAAS